MSDLPKNLRYTKEHEWARKEPDGTITVGITSHAVEQLGDITMVTLPDAGTAITAGENFGDIDSVKAVSELYAPLDGEVLGTNDELEDAPEKINDDPYGEGWMIKIKPASSDAYDDLLDAAAYAKLVEEEE
jgi:glycine cleavage system H protein